MTASFDRSRFPPTSILASAGSGKTHALTSRYLSLLAAGVGVHSILASTFTRLAAGEIRDRLLDRLARAAESPDDRGDLARTIGRKELSRAEVLDLIRTLMRNIHRLQIRTLDSFFGSLVNCHALELGMPLAGRIIEADEAAAVRREAIGRVLAGGGDAGAVGDRGAGRGGRRRLVTLLRRLTQGSTNRSVFGVIDRVVAELYEIYREADFGAWEWVPHLPTLPRARLPEALGRLEAAAPTQPGSHIKAHRTDCDRARAGDWEGFVGKGLAPPIATGDRTYYKSPIEPHVIEAYQPIIDHARAVLINRLRGQTIATRRLLSLFDSEYRSVKQRLGVLTFPDIMAAMLDAQRLGTFDEMCFRIDAAIRHLLLDEFQDTSVGQWRALEPIALQIVSDETEPRSFLCVGDVKQSIYGWRDACPEILDQIRQLLSGPDGSPAIVPETLTRSYRSSPVVIDVVNLVFGSLTSNPALEEFPEARELFARGFSAHDTARKELSGYVVLRTVKRAGPDQSTDALRLTGAATLVKMLHEQAPGMSIGVLTATNRAVSRLLFEFGPGRLNLPASGRGGGPLTDSPAVNVILDLLRLADHPDDTICGFNVARSPLGPLIDLPDEADVRRRRLLARRIRRRLLDEGFAATIARWTKLFAPACDARQYGRLHQLIDLAGRYDTQPTGRVDDFVQIVQNRPVTGGPRASIQVMTIHQSKGLEFDIVVLPELQRSLAGDHHPPVVFQRAGEVGPITRICRWANSATRSLFPQIEPLFARHRTRTVRESLCLLYVAMTRAKSGLYMLIDPPPLRKSGAVSTTVPKSAAGVLVSALAAGRMEPDSVGFERGDPQWLRGKQRRPEREAAPGVPGPITLALPAKTRILIAPPVQPSSYGRAGALGCELRSPDAEALDRGRVIHRLFEQVEWIEDFQPADERLVRVAQAAAPRRPASWVSGQVSAFLEALQRPAVRQTLARGTRAPGTLRLWREQPYARLVAGAIEQGVIDRLEAQGVEGSFSCATVIDFKTDPVDATGAAAAAEGYRGQLTAYRAAAAAMLRIPPAQVRMVVLFVIHGAAVEVEGGATKRQGDEGNR